MTIDWMNGQISRDALAELADRAARYSPRARQLETFWRDTSLRQIQYFIAVLEDPGAPCQQRQGWLPRLDPPITRQAFMEDIELNIRVQLTLLDRRMAADLDDIWTPSWWPLFGNNHCTGAFGCVETFTDPMLYPWVPPILEDPSDVYTWTPDLKRSAVAQRILAGMARWRELTGESIPIRAPDLFGPETAASQVLGAIPALEMVLAHPEELRHFLDLYMSVLDEWLGQQFAAAGDTLYPGTFHARLPAGWINIGSDSLVMLSPDHIKQFYLPHYRRLMQSFDGLLLHYCGGNTHLLPVLKEIPGFRGVDSQFGLEQYPLAREILGPEPVILTLIVDGPPGTHEVRPEFLREYLEMIKGDRTILWARTDSLDDAYRLEETIHRYGR